MYHYSAIVRKVVDGDTLEIDIDLGLSVWVKKERIRLYGINTPEVYGVKKGSSEWQSGNQASEFVKANLRESDELIVETIKDAKEKYGRYLAVVYFRANQSVLSGLTKAIRQHGEFYCLNDIMVAKGLAVEYMI